MRDLVRSLLVSSLSVVAALGCGAGAGGTGGSDNRYADESLWLCRPGITDDQCALADLSTTVIRADGSTEVSNGPAMNPDAPFDCFIVYETVDLSLEPGNASDPSRTDGAILEALYRNGVRFRERCRMYAPLYRQITLGTFYAATPWDESAEFETAYQDVAEAFEHYMSEHNQGRGIVLIEHSQGAGVLARLIEETFDRDEALRKQLISALLIGAGERIYVPIGELVGGNFQSIPLCASATDTGCVIAFDTLADPASASAQKQVPDGHGRACVNPASFDETDATLAAAMFARSSVWAPQKVGEEDVTTEWVSYPMAYEAFCGVFLWIGVADADTAPFTPFELQQEQREIRDSEVGQNLPGSPGLHWSNFSLLGEDLIRVVQTQAATR